MVSLSKAEHRLNVPEARDAILTNIKPVAGREMLPLDGLVCGRVTERPIWSPASLPRHDLSAMDGYALAHAGLDASNKYEIIGESAAGKPHIGAVGSGEAVRIFTGAILPKGTDSVVIQEDCAVADNILTIDEASRPPLGHCVRKSGLDVAKNELLIDAGIAMTTRHLALCLAADIQEIEVYAKPNLTILASGDELRRQGEKLEHGQIYDSTSMPLMMMARSWGANAYSGPVMRDDPDVIATQISDAGDSDLLVTIGGASVGDHDHMNDVLLGLGYDSTFWKINMRPGKPLMFATHPSLPPILALPGNPVSAMVCAMLFLRPAIEQLCGKTTPYNPIFFDGILAHDLPAGSAREDYMRATMRATDLGVEITPAPTQDSSMLKVFADCHCLLVRPPGDAPCLAGERVKFLPI